MCRPYLNHNDISTAGYTNMGNFFSVSTESSSVEEWQLIQLGIFRKQRYFERNQILQDFLPMIEGCASWTKMDFLPGFNLIPVTLRPDLTHSWPRSSCLVQNTGGNGLFWFQYCCRCRRVLTFSMYKATHVFYYFFGNPFSDQPSSYQCTTLSEMRTEYKRTSVNIGTCVKFDPCSL